MRRVLPVNSIILKIIITCILSISIMLQNPTCLAKFIYDNTGEISFETNNNWYYTSLGEDSTTTELISLVYNNDTFIKFSQGKLPMRYNNMRDISHTEKSVIMDSLIKYHINMLKEKGYSVYINKTDVLSDTILTGYTITKNDIKYKMITCYCIKDYHIYSLVIGGTKQTIYTAFNVAKTLKINGILFDNWLKM